MLPRVLPANFQIFSFIENANRNNPVTVLKKNGKLLESIFGLPRECFLPFAVVLLFILMGTTLGQFHPRLFGQTGFDPLRFLHLLSPWLQSGNVVVSRRRFLKRISGNFLTLLDRLTRILPRNKEEAKHPRQYGEYAADNPFQKRDIKKLLRESLCET